MFEVSTELYFSSAHRLRGYKGKCESLHGHNWRVKVMLAAKELNGIGLVIDFHDLKSVLSSVLGKMDHKYLNEITYFKKNNPTAENIAKFIYCELKKEKNLKKAQGLKVSVWESEKNCASYYE